ncbi:MAG TPA: hypothetical protein VF041_03430 [Gemmatimonadaceae bacterium]
MPMGAVVSLDTLWRLAERWYEGRLHPGWRRGTVGEAQGILRQVGLTDPFWNLAR